MAYQRIATPRIYPCAINHSLSLGKMATTDLTQTGITTASPIEMFDLKPSNTVTIGGNGTSTQHQIIMNFQEASDTFVSDSNFMLIFGHNFYTAGVKFKLQHDDDSAFGSAQSPPVTELVNIGGDFASGYYAQPPNNGWSLFTWEGGETDNQYDKLVLDSVAGNYDADIKS